jgi:hypothetical protein
MALLIQLCLPSDAYAGLQKAAASHLQMTGVSAWWCLAICCPLSTQHAVLPYPDALAHTRSGSQVPVHPCLAQGVNKSQSLGWLAGLGRPVL